MNTTLPTAHAADDLIEKAEDLLAAGLTRDDAANQLSTAAASDRHALEWAYNRWLQTMHRRPSNDGHAVAVLRTLERALAGTPRERVFEMGPLAKRR